MSIINPHGIIPEGFIAPDKMQDVLLWIRQAPYPSGFRRGLLRGWAAATGKRPSAAMYDMVGAGTVRVTPVDVSTAISQLGGRKT